MTTNKKRRMPNFKRAGNAVESISAEMGWDIDTTLDIMSVSGMSARQLHNRTKKYTGFKKYGQVSPKVEIAKVEKRIKEREKKRGK